MPTPKRFAFVIADLYGGGAEKSLLYTADGLRQRGHVVKIFILRDKIEHRLPEGLEIENLGVINRFSKLFSTVWVEKWQATRIARFRSGCRAVMLLRQDHPAPDIPQLVVLDQERYLGEIQRSRPAHQGIRQGASLL
ncbi:hypothetical protein [Chromohalobacter japonicus]|uniref:hypothetical protein n=1 Tax=Chromohalobacter japonicus TaxID=223900 RepID=UPI00058B04DE|nr:hypothetical protein [Chromohalobacter japonicus]